MSRPTTRARLNELFSSALPFRDHSLGNSPPRNVVPSYNSSPLTSPPSSPSLQHPMANPLGTPFATSTPSGPDTTANSGNANSITMSPDQLNTLLSTMMTNLQATMQASVQTSVQASIQAAMQTSMSASQAPSAPHDSSRSTRAIALENARSTIPKLDPRNFSQWESTVSSVIKKAGLWEYIEPGVQPPSTTDKNAYDKYLLESSAVFSALTGSLEESARFQYADGQDTPRDLWNNLFKHFRNDEIPYLMSLNRQLATISLSEGGNALEHVAEITRLRRRLLKTRFEVSEDFALCILLGSLPSSYNTWVTLQQNQGTNLTFASACASLETYYRSQARATGEDGVSAFIATAKLPRGDLPCIPEDLRPYLLPGKATEGKCAALANRARGTCRDCLRTGHNTTSMECPQYLIRLMLWGPRKEWVRNPRKSSGSLNKSPQANVAESSTAGQSESSSGSTMTASVAYIGPSSVYPTFKAMSATISASIANLPTVDSEESIRSISNSPTALVAAKDRQTFLMDSGCQVHLTCLLSPFTEFRTLKKPIEVSGIGNHIVYATGIGHISLPVTFGGELYWFELKDVLYAADLGRNLISLGALRDAGITYNDDGSDLSPIYVRGSPNNILAYMRYHDRLWHLDVDHSVMAALAGRAANVATTAPSWHRRLNHIGISALQDLAKAGSIPSLSKADIQAIQNCGTCVLGKGTRLPFYKSITPLAANPLSLVHTDLACVMHPTISGYRYLALFLDDCTQMSWGVLLKSKDELFSAFKALRARLELQSGYKLKVLRSDGGGEYNSKPLRNLLADAGIVHQTTCANSSQSNGVIERLGRSLFDRTRCMLSEGNFSKGYWGEAVMNAIHTRNHSPSTALPDHASPVSRWTGNKNVSVSHFRVFGSVCYAIDTSKHRKKLEPRAIECRFLGYEENSKAYRLLLKGTTKIIKSRDVIFHEDKSLLTSPPTEVDLPSPYTDSSDAYDGDSMGDSACSSEGVVDSVGDATTSVGDAATSAEEAAASVGEAEDSEPGLTVPPSPSRPKRTRKKTWKLRESAEANTASARLPKSIKQALSGPDAELWRQPVLNEFDSWKRKGVYEVVLRTPDMEVLPSMDVLTVKTDESGNEVKKKVRIVVRGDMQSQSPDEGPAHSSPVARLDTLRLLASKAAINNFELQQMDVNTAYLHAPLSNSVYMKIPFGFPEDELLPNTPRDKQVLRLKRAVYGLKEAPHAWYNYCAGIFADNGFVRSHNDLCLFSTTPPNSDTRCFVLVYVDDFTLLAKNPDDMNWLKGKLNALFDLKDLGAASQVLGIEIIRNREDGSVKLTQRKFVRQLLEEYDLLDCRTLPTPMFANANTALPSHTAPLSDEDKHFMADKDFRHLLGCLNWLALGTRPDIAYALARLGQAQSNPHPEHWQALVHVLRYLSGTLDMGLFYSARAKKPEPHMYMDSSYADCSETRKSHSGYVVMVGGAAVAWSSRKQPVVTTSSTEAEYIAMGVAGKEAAWMRRLLLDLDFKLDGPLRIYADNQSSLILSTSEKLSTRTKHLDVQYHFVRELIKKGICTFIWVSTKLNVADVLTKPLGPNIFVNMPPMLGLPWVRRNSPSDS